MGNAIMTDVHLEKRKGGKTVSMDMVKNRTLKESRAGFMLERALPLLPALNPPRRARAMKMTNDKSKLR
jgi:hypothetical protein